VQVRNKRKEGARRKSAGRGSSLRRLQVKKNQGENGVMIPISGDEKGGGPLSPCSFTRKELEKRNRQGDSD